MVDILLVEDNPGDVLLTKVALQEGDIRCNLHVAADGVEAMSYLRREGAHAAAVRPALILLDLNLPRKDGREVLAEVKGDPELRGIPVLILTTSQAERDVLEAYDLHANGYITKPMDLGQFMDAMRVLKEFWFAAASLPRIAS